MLKSTLTAVAIATLLASPTMAQAQDTAYPERTVTILVPNAPGGGTDFMARLLAQELGSALGQTFVVENREGANGNLAMREVAGAEPDGYTLIFTSTGTIATNPFLYADVGFDPRADFTPVSLPVRFFQVLAINPEAGFANVADMIAYGKEHPGEITVGNGGLGGTSHLATELFQRMAGIEVTVVPYKGTSPAVTATLSGELSATFTGLPAGAPHFETGGLIPIGMTSAKSSPLLENVPAIAESVPGYEMDGWFAMFAPAGTPDEAVAVLSEEIDRILAKPEIVEQLTTLAYEIVGGGPDTLGAVLESDLTRYEQLVRDAEIRIE